MAILLDLSRTSNNPVPLDRQRIMTAAAIYLGVKNEVLQYEGVTEEFARACAMDAHDRYIRSAGAGR